MIKARNRSMPLEHIRPAEYPQQLAAKVANFRQAFAPFDLPEPEVIPSAPLHYRLRAEFRITHDNRQVNYAMFAPGEPKVPVVIEHFPVADQAICDLMPRLRALIQASNTLKDGLFQVDFLATLSGERMATLIYHQPVGSRWETAARTLAETLQIQVIGRSKGKKIVVDRDWLLESFELNGRRLSYQQIEGSFTQPNGVVNRQMLAWACRQAAPLGGDLLELYCGNGNFTVALAPMFERVLATEVSKSSVLAANYNLQANALDNVTVVRLPSEDLAAVLTGSKTCRELPAEVLAQYKFSTLFVDPPRSGLDAQTIALARGFDHVLYISCNPDSLKENVAALHDSHRIQACALFDQFPYTHHLESGLLLVRRDMSRE
jgi:tRNA (uracil-5-)-methyltransferase